MSKTSSFRTNRTNQRSSNQWKNRGSKAQRRYQKPRQKSHGEKQRNQNQRQRLALQQRTLGRCGRQTKKIFFFYVWEQTVTDNCNRKDQALTFSQKLQENSCESYKILSSSQELYSLNDIIFYVEISEKTRSWKNSTRIL